MKPFSSQTLLNIPIMDGINIQRAQIQTRGFHLLLAAAKACLFPFLTVYFRGLGLNALQTGIVISVKAWLLMLFAPLWTKCAFRCNKKKTLLMFSVFMMLTSNILLAFVPSSSQQMVLLFCEHDGQSNDSITNATNTLKGGLLNSSMFEDVVDTTEDFNTVSNVGPTTLSQEPSPNITNEEESGPQFDPVSLFNPANSSSDTQDKDNAAQVFEQLTSILLGKGYTQQQLDRMTSAEFREAAIKVLEEMNMRSADLFPDTERKRSLGREEVNRERHRRDVRHSVMKKLSQWHENLNNVNGLTQLTFVSVLVIVIIGEILSAPVSRLADDLWFEFLDCLDVLEKYGKEVPWSSLGYMTLPLFVTLIVTSSPCLLSYDIHRFMIHFYVFAVIAGLCFVVAFFYPVQSAGRKVKRTNHVLRGLKILVSDVHSFSLTFTAFLVGFLYAPLANYCFWMVQNTGGSELIMGGAVAASAFGDFIMYFAKKWLLHKLGVTWAVVLCLATLALRLFLYSFMWTAWMVIPGDLLHCFSYTLMWATIQSYQDFKMNPFVMDRSAQAVLQAIHHGLGFAVGSLLAGFLYDIVGVGNLFLGSSIMAVVWCIIFLLLHRCCKKPEKVRYTQLLQGEEEDFSDSFDDDWLEVAMKEDK